MTRVFSESGFGEMGFSETGFGETEFDEMGHNRPTWLASVTDQYMKKWIVVFVIQ